MTWIKGPVGHFFHQHRRYFTLLNIPRTSKITRGIIQGSRAPVPAGGGNAVKRYVETKLTRSLVQLTGGVDDA